MRLQLRDVELAIVDCAARRRGQSRSTFVRDAVVQAARAALEEHTLIQMSPDGFKAFQMAVAAPAKAFPPLVELLQRRSSWEPGDSA